MKIYNFHHYPKSNTRQSLALLVFFFLFVLLTASPDEASGGERPRKHGAGILTNVEKNNNIVSVVISEKGYTLDPSVLIVNIVGRPIAINELTVPSEINFEYSYMESAPKTMSPVIVYIEEANKNSNKGRSKR